MAVGCVLGLERTAELDVGVGLGLNYYLAKQQVVLNVDYVIKPRELTTVYIYLL